MRKMLLRGYAPKLWEDVPLIGSPDITAIGVAEELNRPLYAPECHCLIRFVRFSSSRTSSRFENAAIDLAGEQHRSGKRTMLLIASYPLEPIQVTDLSARSVNARFLKGFSGAEVWGENFFLYRLDLQTSGR